MRKHGIELKDFADGAAAEELARGESAAWAVFENAGVNPWATARAAFKQEGDWKSITDEEAVLAELWRVAEYEAVQACCTDWQTEPTGVNLELVGDPNSAIAYAVIDWR